MVYITLVSLLGATICAVGLLWNLREKKSHQDQRRSLDIAPYFMKFKLSCPRKRAALFSHNAFEHPGSNLHTMEAFFKAVEKRAR